MNIENKATIEKVLWKDVREAVSKVNPELAKIIDQLDPGKNYPLYRAKYPYGSTIVDQGKFYVPTKDGELSFIDAPNVDPKIRADLEYPGKGIPAGMVLNNATEVFIDSGNRVFPWALFSQGDIFAFWKKLDLMPSFHPAQLFSITAGARSVFMIPNIGDIHFHKNIQRDFGIRLQPPKDLLNQWEIFKKIIKYDNYNCNWSAELIFFPLKWVEKLKQNNLWNRLYLFLLAKSWQSSAYTRNQIFYDFSFSWVQASRNLKPNPYLMDTVKHLIAIAMGGVVGFGVAENDLVAPVTLLQKIYLDSYGLKKYVPTVMHPAYFSIDAKASKSIYYSLQFPTTLEFSPKSRKLSTTLNDLRELKHILNVFLNEVLKGKLKVEDTVIGKVAREVNFDFLHNKVDLLEGIKSTKNMQREDPMLIKCLSKCKNIEFADSGSFVRGCVRISVKKEQTNI